MLKRTSAEEIRGELAARIIGGTLLPGTALDETIIAGDHAKALVARPDETKLAGMFEVMGYLEALCAGLCAALMKSHEREELDALHLEMAGIVHAGDASGYAEANDVFHAAIYEGAHNAYLSEITRSTRQRVAPFRRAQFGTPGRLARSHSEHGFIVEAILRGDQPAAETAMRRHISIVEDTYQRLGREA